MPLPIPTFKVLRERKLKLIKNATYAETKFQQRLIGGKIRFEFQEILPPYIVDFLISKRLVIIELDGKHHDDQKDYDKRRTQYFQRRGFAVIRIPNAEVMTWPLSTIRKYPKIKGYTRIIANLRTEFIENDGILTRPPKTKGKSEYVKEKQVTIQCSCKTRAALHWGQLAPHVRKKDGKPCPYGRS